MTTTSTNTPTITEARLSARRHALNIMAILDAAEAFKLADDALTDATEQTYTEATEAYSSTLDALIEAARAFEVER